MSSDRLQKVKTGGQQKAKKNLFHDLKKYKSTLIKSVFSEPGQLPITKKVMLEHELFIHNRTFKHGRCWNIQTFNKQENTSKMATKN